MQDDTSEIFKDCGMHKKITDYVYRQPGRGVLISYHSTDTLPSKQLSNLDSFSADQADKSVKNSI